MNIRFATKHDVEAISQMRGQAGQRTRIIGATAEQQAKWVQGLFNQQRIKEAIENADNSYYVAVDNNEIRGAYVLEPQSDGILMLNGLYCASDKSGLGSTLLDHALHEVIIMGYSSVSITVMKGNMQAREFFERKGFVYTANKESRVPGWTLDCFDKQITA